MNLVNFSGVLCSCTILFICVMQGYSAVLRIENSESPDRRGVCEFKDDVRNTSIFLNPGETKKHPNECGAIFCADNFELQINGCGLIAVDSPNCTFVKGKISDPYPGCCGDIKCNGKN